MDGWMGEGWICKWMEKIQSIFLRIARKEGGLAGDESLAATKTMGQLVRAGMFSEREKPAPSFLLAGSK